MTTHVSAWQPQAGPQAKLVSCPIATIVYGGARGGGKTVGMILKNCFKAAEYGRHQKGIFFRKELPQLEAAIETCKEIYLPLGWKWAEQKKTFTAPNGATLKFRPLERDSDAEKYMGMEFTDLYFEELTNWADPKPINRLRSTLRSAAGVPCQFHATCNPGGPGHQWVKAWIVDPCPAGYKTLIDEFGGARIFIPAKVSDNRALMEADPDYTTRIRQSGSKELVKAWLDGDWNIVEGAFFDCWCPQMVHKPFLVPKDWARIVSFDWGSAKPFSTGWWAIVTDDYLTPEGVLLPRGYALRYREWYGVKYEGGEVKPDLGLKMSAEAIGDGIRKRTHEDINAWVADPAIFKEDGGPSQAERMGLKFRAADNTRIARLGHMGGWDQMRSRMVGTRSHGENGQLQDDGVPMIGCFDTCVDSIRTIPALQHDANKPEDLDTASEDHAADEWRYFCMSRPIRARQKTAEVVQLDPWGRRKQPVNNWKTA